MEPDYDKHESSANIAAPVDVEELIPSPRQREHVSH